MTLAYDMIGLLSNPEEKRFDLLQRSEPEHLPFSLRGSPSYNSISPVGFAHTVSFTGWM